MPLETRREFTRHALQSLTALALIEGLAAHRLFGADVRPIVDDWFQRARHDQPRRARPASSRTSRSRRRWRGSTAASTCPRC